MNEQLRLLEQERRETIDRIERLTEKFRESVVSSRDSNADDEHDPEGPTIAFERSQVGALTDQARHHLAEVDDAIGRLWAGTYGSCEQCGRAIPSGRLEARPVARFCVECAAAR